MKEILKDLSVSLRILVLGVLIFSIAYSGVIGVVGQALLGNRADGSLIRRDGEVVGSELIGQDFDGSEYFHSRPSSIDYNAMESGSQNLAPNNPELTDRVENILQEIANDRESENLKVPSVLVAESGSALDPHITPRAAFFQVPRIAKNTGISEQKLRSLIEEYSKDKLFGLYGLRRVNALKLNLEVENLTEGG